MSFSQSLGSQTCPREAGRLLHLVIERREQVGDSVVRMERAQTGCGERTNRRLAVGQRDAKRPNGFRTSRMPERTNGGLSDLDFAMSRVPSEHIAGLRRLGLAKGLEGGRLR